MNLADWRLLAEDDQANRCLQLSPYEDWGLFKEIEAEFEEKFGDQPGIQRVFCGLAAGLGPCNSITIEIKRGQRPVRIPKTYLGFPVLRSYNRE